MHVNARAIIERETANGVEIVVQVRNKPHEGGKWIELPGGRVEEFEPLIEALTREVHEETGLVLTHIQGQDTRIETQAEDTNVECLRPLAVYQTITGPVDSMGVYFRCQGEGELLVVGDDTEQARWMPVRQIAEQIEPEAGSFSWVDRAGLFFYLKQMGRIG
ncbi:MAG: NUDIX hydrolase [Anaerolineae bacterium]|nr:NUDIX hydrolase [Anaerolineae bacterium]